MDVPPEELVDAVVVLRRAVEADAEELARAVEDSLDHLHPWMPWATHHSAAPVVQRERLAAMRWEPGSDWDFTMRHPDGGAVIGGCSLMHRQGPGTLEIGYWVHVAHTGRGVATAAARLLSETGAAIDGISEVQIRCDEANLRSAAIPRRLGYRLDRRAPRPVEAPGECGTTLVWVLPVGT